MQVFSLRAMIQFSRPIFSFLLLTAFSCSGRNTNEENIRDTIPVKEQAHHQNDSSIKVIHVFVALCDNKYQGIVSVPASIGNGQDPKTNLYWGCKISWLRAGKKTAYQFSSKYNSFIFVFPTNPPRSLSLFFVYSVPLRAIFQISSWPNLKDILQQQGKKILVCRHTNLISGFRLIS